MAARSGRDLLIQKAGTTIAAVRTKTVSIDGSPVDISSDDDGGHRKLASFAGAKSIDISVEGVVDDAVFGDLMTGSGSLLLTDVTIENFPDTGDTLACDFYVASFEQAGSHDGEQTYTMEFQSSGTWAVS